MVASFLQLAELSCASIGFEAKHFSTPRKGARFPIWQRPQ